MRIRTDRLRLYPDPKIEKLTDAIAERYGLNSNQVFVGVGSDDVLAMCFMTFFNSNRPILFPDITYSFYDVWAEEFRIPYKQIPLDGNSTIRPEDYAGENGGIVFPNPNAPTGKLLPLEDVERIIAQNPDVIVIVDEAHNIQDGERGVEFYAVNKDYPEEKVEYNNHFSRKIKADLFIDDRNIGGLPDWGQIYQMIHEGKTYPQVLNQTIRHKGQAKKKKSWWPF